MAVSLVPRTYNTGKASKSLWFIIGLDLFVGPSATMLHKKKLVANKAQM